MFIPCIHIGQSIFQYPTPLSVYVLCITKKTRYQEHKLEGPKKHRTAKNRSIVWNFGEWI